MKASRVRLRLEQNRQARSIHGGALNMYAAAMGVKLSRLPIPSRRLRERLFRKLYGGKYSALCEQELERPLADYRSLNELFTRGVRAECRPLPVDADSFLCPCDSTVQETGRLADAQRMTVKGVEYTLASLLPGMPTERFAGGQFAVFFLSPADCHRVFCPQDAQLEQLVHVPGRRLLVHPSHQPPRVPSVLAQRAGDHSARDAAGACLLVMVAGWGVGNITYPFPVGLKPHRRARDPPCAGPAATSAPRAWLATFELGSTVIMITEPRPTVVSHLRTGEAVKYGEPAFTFERTS
ncbi:MAG: phosphatidylserine decarboxylase [Pirellulales bacterium]